jgi:hypothetical protein
MAGLVIRYAYLWRTEYLRGQEESTKDRPCAVILTLRNVDGEWRVFVLPITHRPPSDQNDALEIPHETKKRLGLDGERSWIVLTEANDFIWPGPDLRPMVSGGDPTDIVYGVLPKILFEQMRDRFVENLRKKRAKATLREG